MVEDKEIREYVLKNREDIKEVELIKTVIAIYVPSMKQLFKVLRECDIFIDSQSKEFKKLIQESYYLKNKKGVDTTKRIESILNAFSIGSNVICDYNDFGRGIVTDMFSDNLMLIKFDSRDLPVMCNSETMTTVHYHKLFLYSSLNFKYSSNPIISNHLSPIFSVISRSIFS